jgi:hypothetical protein
MLDGMILDGRCRWDACKNAGVEPRIVQYQGSDPVGFVVSRNLKRRHLNEGQRAMIAARLATLADGQRQVGKFADVPTQAQAAERLKVSERSIRDARTVLDHGSPDLIAEVDKGEVAVSKAAKIVRSPPRARKAPKPEPLTGEIVSTAYALTVPIVTKQHKIGPAGPGLMRVETETLSDPRDEGHEQQVLAANGIIGSLSSIRDSVGEYHSGVFVGMVLALRPRQQTEVLEAIGFVGAGAATRSQATWRARLHGPCRGGR